MTYKNSSLWMNAFNSPDGDQNVEARVFFRNALDDFRANTIPLLTQISKDLPELTVHDISHIDALWQTGSTITGAAYPINPAEAFVLGGAFLLHDAAMSIVAFGPAREKQLQETVAWRDAIAQCYRKDSKEVRLDFPHPNQYVLIANQAALRELHAQQAERLPFIEWEGRALLSDPDLREGYGELIGKIAHSHWWDASELSTKFGRPKGAIALPPPKPQLPGDWTIDSFKIACILRASDASHIDARRAPAFLRRLVKPEGVAKDHWFFQERLNQVYAREDTLFYTSGRRFPETHSDAWWLCFDTIQMIDRELRATDAALLENGCSRFAIRKVAGAERADELANHIETLDWKPVDTRLKVSDVGHLARTLGGEQLYGSRSARVPLRELIANAADAIRARRALPEGGLSPNEGSIWVKIDKNEDDYYLTVEDDGLGMSPKVMSTELIDFGKSLWRTHRVHQEWPGLLSTSFEPTGKYGIGFFSTFMWGDEVTVRSRRFDKGRDEGHALIFKGGLQNRPILKPLSQGELKPSASTSITIRLKFNPFEETAGSEIGLFCYKSANQITACDPANIITAICPTIDVDIFFRSQDGKETRVLEANEWSICDFSKFIDLYNTAHRFAPDNYHLIRHDRTKKPYDKRLEKFIYNENGAPVARLWISAYSATIITVGGFEAEERTGYCAAGFATGTTNVAARSEAQLSLPYETVAKAISEKSALLNEILKKNIKRGYDICWLSNFAIAHGEAVPDDLPIVQRGLTFSALQDLLIMLEAKKKLILCNADLLSETIEGDPQNIFFDIDVVANSAENIFVYSDDSEYRKANSQTGKFSKNENTFVKYVVDRLAGKAISVKHTVERVKIAQAYGQDIYRFCHILEKKRS